MEAPLAAALVHNAERPLAVRATAAVPCTEGSTFEVPVISIACLYRLLPGHHGETTAADRLMQCVDRLPCDLADLVADPSSAPLADATALTSAEFIHLLGQDRVPPSRSSTRASTVLEPEFVFVMAR